MAVHSGVVLVGGADVEFVGFGPELHEGVVQDAAVAVGVGRGHEGVEEGGELGLVSSVY